MGLHKESLVVVVVNAAINEQDGQIERINMPTHLGESRIALRHVLREENGVLTQQERDELLQVVKQLDDILGARPTA